jgi:hypothetical protein
MISKFTLLGLVILASSFCGVGRAQSIPMPRVTPDSSSQHYSYGNIYAAYCTYNWGVSYNCRYLIGRYDETGNYIELNQQRTDTVNRIYGARSLTCRVKAGAWRASSMSAAIPAIALDTSSPDCSTGGYLTTCDDNGCETNDWVYFDTITVEGSWSDPGTVTQSNSVRREKDRVNGTSRNFVCKEETSSPFMVGGWSFLGNYYPVGDWYSEEGSPTASGSAQRYDQKCTGQ